MAHGELNFERPLKCNNGYYQEKNDNKPDLYNQKMRAHCLPHVFFNRKQHYQVLSSDVFEEWLRPRPPNKLRMYKADPCTYVYLFTCMHIHIHTNVMDEIVNEITWKVMAK